MVIDIKSRQLQQNSEAKTLFSFLSREDDHKQVFEIRGIKAMLITDKKPYDKPRIISGYFNDADLLASTIMQIDPNESSGVYITINPCKKAMLSKAVNRLRGEKDLTTTADTHIARRQILFLDCDPDREGGIKDIPTDDNEHQTALDFIEYLTDALTQRGWPQPIKIDSGNGAYALYAIDLPADDGGLVQRVLAGLSKEYDTEVKIDQTAFNLSRIMRVPGTWNRKADSTDERPHRVARIISVPEVFDVVSKEQLEAVALIVEQEETVTSTSVTTKTHKPNNERLTSPEDFLKRNHLTYRVDQGNGYTKYVLTDGCVFNPEHKGRDAAIIERPDGWGYKCFHNSCTGKSWEDFAKHVEPGYLTSKEKQDAYEAAQAVKKATKSKKDTTDQDEEEKENKPNQTQVLLEICRRAKYFKTPEGELCASVPINGHRETVVIGEKGGFRMWLIKRYYDQTGNAANTTATQQAIEIVAAGVMENAPVEPLFTRVGSKNGRIYLDMANDKHQVIEVSATGWRVLDISPVYFRKPSGTLPLPTPVEGGSIEELRPFLNLNPKNEETGDDSDWCMIVGYILMLLHPTGPYPVLALGGEQGATKSSTARFIRKVIDPNIAISRPVPKEERDMAIAARSNWVISFENLSHIPEWLSDAMCRMSTGAGYGTRALWENDKEAVFANKRPQIVNGISDLITKSDLLSRTVSVGLPVMDKSKYRTETQLNEEYDKIHPRILGALLTIISTAIRNLPTINAPSSSRMVEMEMWVRAAEPILGWKAGSFSKCFVENQDNGIDVVLEASQVAKAVMSFMDERGLSWVGNSTLLYTQLKTVMGTDLDYKSWPANPKTLSDALKKLAPALRTRGYQIIHRRTGKERKIELSFSDAEVTQTTRKVTQNGAEVTQENSPASLPNEAKTPKKVPMSDASDAEIPTLSNPDIFQKEESEEKKQLIERLGKSASPASLAPIDFEDEDKFKCKTCGVHADNTEEFQFDDNAVGYCGVCWKQI